MKITAKHYLTQQAENQAELALINKDWARLATISDKQLTPEFKDFIFTISIRKDELEQLPDFIKDRFLINYWAEESDDKDEDDDEDDIKECGGDYPDDDLDLDREEAREN